MNSIKDMTLDELQSVKDAIADVMCWHYGFLAAKPDYQSPPQLYLLRDFARNLQAHIDDERDKEPKNV